MPKPISMPKPRCDPTMRHRPRPRTRFVSKRLLLPVIILIAGLLMSRLQPRYPALAPSDLPYGTFSGKVVGVADGDTIDVLYKNAEVKVRLFGVDCPEKDQAYGSRATRFTSDMVFGETVNVDVRDHDRYGRVVAWVTSPDGKSLNEELVRAGMAWWYEHYDPDDTRLSKLQDEARNAARGLWADKNPMPPWDFRKVERNARGVP